jgi:hypothetical protein
MLAWQLMCLEHYDEAPERQWHGQGPDEIMLAHRPSEGHNDLTREPVSTWANTAAVQWRNTGASILNFVGRYRPTGQQVLSGVL